MIDVNELQIDCYQNIIVKILQNNGCNVAKLGAFWPWKFDSKVEDVGRNILSLYTLASDERILKYFDYKIERKYFSDNNFEEQLRNILEKEKIIVNVDSYYVPHHYANIYHKKHGQHSILLTKYGDENIECEDTLPQYVGLISTSELIKGIINYPSEHVHMQYSYIKKETTVNKHDLYQEFREFQNSLCVCENGIDRKLDILSLLAIIEVNKEEMSEENFWSWFTYVMEGAWLWRIDKLSGWLKCYMQLVDRRLSPGYEIGKIEQQISLIDAEIYGGVRKMYSAYLRQNKEGLGFIVTMRNKLRRYFSQLHREILTGEFRI